MIGYILLTNIVYNMIEINGLDVSHDIRTGNLNNYLIRPMNYFNYRLILYLSKVIVNSIGYIVPIMAIFCYFHIHILSIMYFIILLLEAIILHYLINYLLSICTFWLFNISSLFYLINIIISFFSGTMLPLDMMPEIIIKCSNYLPFKNLGYEVSASIFLYRSEYEIWIAIQNGILWIAILYVIIKILWKAGVKRYEAFSG